MTVDLEKAREDIEDCAQLEALQSLREIAIQLADEVERLEGEGDVLCATTVSAALEIRELKEALGKIEKECRDRIATGCGYDVAIHEIARAALPKDEKPKE